MTLGCSLISYSKVNPKWIKDLNIRPETVKLLEESIINKLLDISLDNVFLDLTTRAKATKAKMKKWDYFKLKSFFTGKETINKIKKQTMKDRKYLQIIYVIVYKKLMHLNTKKNT